MRINFMGFVMVVVFLFFIMGTGVELSVAADYPGKWYGWHCPFYQHETEVMVTPQGWAVPEQKVLRIQVSIVMCSRCRIFMCDLSASIVPHSVTRGNQGSPESSAPR